MQDEQLVQISQRKLCRQAQTGFGRRSSGAARRGVIYDHWLDLLELEGHVALYGLQVCVPHRPDFVHLHTLTTLSSLRTRTKAAHMQAGEDYLYVDWRRLLHIDDFALLHGVQGVRRLTSVQPGLREMRSCDNPWFQMQTLCVRSPRVHAVHMTRTCGHVRIG